MILCLRLLLLRTGRYPGELVVMVVAEDSKLTGTTFRQTRGDVVLRWHVDSTFE
jgi:hypothetical protein